MKHIKISPGHSCTTFRCQRDRYTDRRQVRSWSQTGPKLVAGLLARARSLLAS